VRVKAQCGRGRGARRSALSTHGGVGPAATGCTCALPTCAPVPHLFRRPSPLFSLSSLSPLHASSSSSSSWVLVDTRKGGGADLNITPTRATTPPPRGHTHSPPPCITGCVWNRGWAWWLCVCVCACVTVGTVSGWESPATHPTLLLHHAHAAAHPTLPPTHVSTVCVHVCTPWPVSCAAATGGLSKCRLHLHISSNVTRTHTTQPLHPHPRPHPPATPPCSASCLKPQKTYPQRRGCAKTTTTTTTT